MSKRSWQVFWGICILIVISGTIYSAIQSRTSFKEMVLDQLYESETIDKIRIGKNRFHPNEQMVEITDRAEIDRIMEGLSKVKLRKHTPTDYSGDEYEIWLNTQRSRMIGVYLYGVDHIRFNFNPGHHKKYSWEYKIINDFDRGIIEDLFDDVKQAAK